MTALYTKIAWHYLKERKRQTLTSCLAVSLGIVAYIIVSALVNGNELSFIKQVVDVSPHIIISDEFEDRNDPQPADFVFTDSLNTISHVMSSFEKKGVKNANAILEGISKDYPDVLAAPVLKQQVFLTHRHADLSAQCFGIIPALQDPISNLSQNLVRGCYEDLSRFPNGIILGIELAKKMNVYVGDTITVVAASGASLPFQVVGLLQTGIVSIDYTHCYMALRKAQSFLNEKPIVSEIQIRIKDVNRAPEIAAALRHSFQYSTKSWMDLSANIFSIFKLQRLIIFVVIFAILLVSSMGIYNMISTLVYEKYRDIAILKSIGFQPQGIRLIFLTQGLMICVFGIIVGSLLAFVGIHLLSMIEVDIVGFVKINRLVLDHQLLTYVIGAVMSCVVCVGATLLSIRKAVRVNPVEIIRGSL